MSGRLDPEILAGLVAAVGAIGATPPERIDVAALRAQTAVTFPYYGSLVPPQPDMSVDDHHVERPDGSTLLVRRFTPPEPALRPDGRTAAAVYVHGGGMVCASVDDYAPLLARYAAESGVPLLAVDYRLAPEHPAPAALDDTIAALDWTLAHADALGIDPAAVGLMGDSGGGGIAGAAALAWRDRDRPALAGLVLPYPMLDDRTRTAEPHTAGLVTWTPEANTVAWDAVLGGAEAGPDGYVAPARAADLAGLPPTYLDTGDLDLFRAEILTFAARLSAAGVPLELHVVPGCVHAFEIAVPQARVSQQVLTARYGALRRLASVS